MPACRYRAGRLRARDGSLIGWAVFPDGSLRMAVGFTGPLAWWRARFCALALNVKGR